MKKIITIGAAIVLLSIALADFYINDNSPSNNNAGYAKAGSITNGTPNFTNPGTDPGTDPGLLTVPASATDSKAPVPLSQAVAINDNGANPFPATVSQDESTPQLPQANETKGNQVVVHMEAPKAYFAYFGAPETNYQKKPGHLNFGIEGGVDMNGFYHNASSNMLNNGFHAGGILNICLGDHFALQPGLMYERNGSQATNTLSVGSLDETTTNNITLNYVEVPANVVYKFGGWGTGRFMVGGGPYVSYLASSKNVETTTYVNDNTNTNPAARSATGPVGTVYTGTGDAQSPAAPGTLTDNFRKLDWGAGCFIGCEMPKGLYVKAGAQVGFRNVQQNTDGSYVNRNYNFLLSIGQLVNSKSTNKEKRREKIEN